MNNNWYDWLLQDRLHVINVAVIKPHLPWKRVVGYSDRDRVLEHLISSLLPAEYIVKPDAPTVVIRSWGSPKDECVRYNDKHELIEFYPLAVVNNEWIDWYIKTYIDKENNG